MDSERTITADEALDIAYTWAQTRNLEFGVDYAWTSDTTDSTTVRTTLKSQTSTLASASGKGVGNQSSASGIYEAIEHAAMRYRLPEQIKPCNYNTLPNNNYLERKNLAYAELKDISIHTPIQTLEFYEVSPSMGFDLDNSILYPRIICDISMPITGDLGNMLPYAAHASNTGIAAGNTWNDAALHAINEILERDAESQFLLDQNMGRKTWVTFSLPSVHPMYNLFHELTGGYGDRGALYLLNSIAGYVVCAASVPQGIEAELGFGASFSLDIAIERAITELQQVQYSIFAGDTWQDEGALSEKELSKYPNMHKLSTRKFPIPRKADISYDDICRISHQPPVQQINDAGYKVYARTLWFESIFKGSIWVVHVVIPGFETINNLVFNNPMLPLGRLCTPENIVYLMEARGNAE